MYDFIRLGISVYLLIAVFFGVPDYSIFRWIVFLGVGLLIVFSIVFKEVKTPLTGFFLLLFIIICIIFNPIVPLYLYDKGIWNVIDLFSAIILFIKPILINLVDKPLNDVSSDRFDKYIR